MPGQAPHFTHFDASGQAHMVDVAGKAVTKRIARAAGRITMQPAALESIRAGTASKGDVLGIARIAASNAASNASGSARSAPHIASSPERMSFSRIPIVLLAS